MVNAVNVIQKFDEEHPPYNTLIGLRVKLSERHSESKIFGYHVWYEFKEYDTVGKFMRSDGDGHHIKIITDDFRDKFVMSNNILHWWEIEVIKTKEDR